MSKRVISIGGGEPEFDTPKHIVDAMKKAIDDGHTHYGSFAGIPELKEAIAAKYQAYGVDVNPDYVIVTPGSTMGIYQSLYGLTSPGDDFMTMNPCFFAYYSTFDFVGVKPVTRRRAGGSTSTTSPRLSPRRRRASLSAARTTPRGTSSGRRS